MRNVSEYIDVILEHEGGCVNDPNDPGGETNFGICKRQFPELDIKNLTVNQARGIYLEKYWKPMKLDLIQNELLKLHLFDMGVNAGIGTAIKLLQRILNCKEDGDLGPVTSKLANEYKGDIVEEYKSSRIEYYGDLVKKKPTLLKFLRGWITRVNNTKFK